MNAESIRLRAREVRQRRDRIDFMVAEMQQRLDPKVLTRQATETVRSKGNELAAATRLTAKRRPGAVAAGAGALLLLLAWKPLKSIMKRIRRKRAGSPALVTARPMTGGDERRYEAALHSPLASSFDVPPNSPTFRTWPAIAHGRRGMVTDKIVK